MISKQTRRNNEIEWQKNATHPITMRRRFKWNLVFWFTIKINDLSHKHFQFDMVRTKLESFVFFFFYLFFLVRNYKSSFLHERWSVSHCGTISNNVKRCYVTRIIKKKRMENQTIWNRNAVKSNYSSFVHMKLLVTLSGEIGLVFIRLIALVLICSIRYH